MKKLSAMLKRLDPRDNPATRVLCLVALLTVSTSTAAFAQTSIPILDGILDFIESNKLAIAMVGVAVVGIGMLSKVVAPDWSSNHRGAFVGMVVGGIILAMIPEIAALVVGS